MRNGKDALILSTGSMVCQSIIASDILRKNIKVELMNIHTLKPLNEKIKINSIVLNMFLQSKNIQLLEVLQV